MIDMNKNMKDNEKIIIGILGIVGTGFGILAIPKLINIKKDNRIKESENLSIKGIIDKVNRYTGLDLTDIPDDIYETSKLQKINQITGKIGYDIHTFSILILLPESRVDYYLDLVKSNTPNVKSKISNEL